MGREGVVSPRCRLCVGHHRLVLGVAVLGGVWSCCVRSSVVASVAFRVLRLVATPARGHPRGFCSADWGVG